MSAVKLIPEAVGTAGSSLRREHVLHVFPSFGIGGVPLRMVRIINHFGKRFRHTLIALDGNYEAAAGVAGGSDVSLWPGRGSTRGLFGTIVGSTRVLRR